MDSGILFIAHNIESGHVKFALTTNMYDTVRKSVRVVKSPWVAQPITGSHFRFHASTPIAA